MQVDIGNNKIHKDFSSIVSSREPQDINSSLEAQQDKSAFAVEPTGHKYRALADNLDGSFSEQQVASCNNAVDPRGGHQSHHHRHQHPASATSVSANTRRHRRRVQQRQQQQQQRQGGSTSAQRHRHESRNSSSKNGSQRMSGSLSKRRRHTNSNNQNSEATAGGLARMRTVDPDFPAKEDGALIRGGAVGRGSSIVVHSGALYENNNNNVLVSHHNGERRLSVGDADHNSGPKVIKPGPPVATRAQEPLRDIANSAKNNNDNKAEGAQDGAAGGQAAASPAPKLAQTKIQIGMRLKRWLIISRIGAGSFGETFTAMEVGDSFTQDDNLTVTADTLALINNLPPLSERREVCIKVEQENKNVLRLEALALKKVQTCPQVVRYMASGCTNGMNYLVMEKLGPNLAELRRRSPHGTFNMYTTLKAGISCLIALRGVHDEGLVHRDIKPSNFVTGLPGTQAQSTCFLIDFGLARRFRRSTGEIRPPRENAGFRGTSRYASVASHHHFELGRVDDLWSLLFMLVEFATGTLPWRKYKDKDDIGRCKEESINPHLVRNLPREFQPFLAHLQTLKYEDEPDYDLLLALMQRAVERRGYPPDKPMDWELDPSMMEAEDTAVAAAYVEGRAATPQQQPIKRFPQVLDIQDVQQEPDGHNNGSLPPRRTAPQLQQQEPAAQQQQQQRQHPGASSVAPAVMTADPVGISESPPGIHTQISSHHITKIQSQRNSMVAAGPSDDGVDNVDAVVAGDSEWSQRGADGAEQQLQQHQRRHGGRSPKASSSMPPLQQQQPQSTNFNSTARVSEVEVSCQQDDLQPLVGKHAGSPSGVSAKVEEQSAMDKMTPVRDSRRRVGSGAGAAAVAETAESEALAILGSSEDEDLQYSPREGRRGGGGESNKESGPNTLHAGGAKTDDGNGKHSGATRLASQRGIPARTNHNFKDADKIEAAGSTAPPLSVSEPLDALSQAPAGEAVGGARANGRAPTNEGAAKKNPSPPAPEMKKPKKTKAKCKCTMM